MIPEITETERMAPRNPSKAAGRSEDRIASWWPDFFGKVLRLNNGLALGTSGRQRALGWSLIDCHAKWMSAAALVLSTESATLLSVIVSVGSTAITTLVPDCATVTSPPAALWAVPAASVLAVVPAANMDDESSRTSWLALIMLAVKSVITSLPKPAW